MSPLLLALTVSLAAPDAAFDEPDASVFSAGDPRADVAWTEVGRAQAVWVDARRDLSFRMNRRRAGDLWANQLFADGGLDFKTGEILCPAATNEFFSSARIASSRQRTWVAWRVTLVDRDVIRASQLTAAGLDCGNTVYDPGPGARIGSLQLEESGGAFLLLFESRLDVFALPLDLTAGTPVQVLPKNAAAPVPYKVDPSLAGRGDGGFAFAVRDNGTFIMFDIDARGTAEMAPFSPWTGFALDTNPVLVGPPVRAAFVGLGPLEMSSTLKVGAPPAPPASGPLGVVPPLLVSVERTNANDPSLARTRVVARQNGAWMLTDFSPTASSSIAFPMGEPLAAAGAFNRTAWFSDLGGEFAFFTLAGASTGAGAGFTSATTKSDSSQLQASVVWVDAGVFAVGFMEGPRFFNAGAILPNAAAIIANVNTWSDDGGVYRFHPRPSGPGVAVTAQGASGTTVALTTFSSGQLTGAQVVLSTPVLGLDEAVVGEHQVLAWERGGSTFVYGQGANPTVTNASGISLGRCGARAEGQLLMPYVNGTELKIINVPDQPGSLSLSLSHVVRSDALGVEAPCLTAYGRELLIVANDDRGELRVWKTTVDDVLLNRQAVAIAGLPPRPGSRGVKNPVALGTAVGWQLAWEATVPEGGAIFESSIPFDGGTPQGGIVAASLESRVPLLASAPTGEIVVVWQQFIDIIGAVQVRSQRVDRRPATIDGGLGDAGVTPVDAGTDAGLVIDGGVEVDAGTPDAGTDGGTIDAGLEPDAGVVSDAGVSFDAGIGLDGGTGPTRVAFSACGCGPSGDPALVVFGALLFFVARRRRTASP